MNPIQEGFALEEIIHNASLKIPEIIKSLRENDIRSHFGDNSLNGVDHWIHILIQDKWKESMTQQEVSQFLHCADRIQSRLPSEDNIYLIWASKKEPTTNSLKSLQEKNAIIVCCSISIEALAKNVILQINDCLNTDSTLSLQAIPKRNIIPINNNKNNIVQKAIESFDDSDEGKKLIEDMKLYIKNIHNNIIRKLENAMNTAGITDIYNLMIVYFPKTIEDWYSGKFSKIDYNSYLKAVKTICWPTNKKHLQSRNLFYYVKIRKISNDFAILVNEYEMKRKYLLLKKSSWVKLIPLIKCNAEPITDAEFKGAIENCEDYYYNAMMYSEDKNNKLVYKKVGNQSLFNAFYTHECSI